MVFLEHLRPYRSENDIGKCSPDVSLISEKPSGTNTNVRRESSFRPVLTTTCEIFDRQMYIMIRSYVAVLSGLAVLFALSTAGTCVLWFTDAFDNAVLTVSCRRLPRWQRSIVNNVEVFCFDRV